MRAIAVVLCCLMACLAIAEKKSTRPVAGTSATKLAAVPPTALLPSAVLPAATAPVQPAAPVEHPLSSAQLEQEAASIAEQPAARPALQPAAQSCPGNAGALGTSRTITVSPTEFTRVGSMQYPQTLPLNDHEVVLTFDDGPLPPFTTAILDFLASQCVKATYFLVGRMAQEYPSLVRRIYNDGHTIGTHSENHPLRFQVLPLAGVVQQVERGIASVDGALGDPKALAPYFRIPGLGRSPIADGFLDSQHLVTWSADVVADDWFRHINAQQIVQRAMRRLEAKGRGILLLHDIHPATVLALPMLFKQLKEQGFRIVQVVPGGERPTSLPEPAPAPTAEKAGWPRVVQSAEPAAKPPIFRKRVARNDAVREAAAPVVRKRPRAHSTAAVQRASVTR